MKRIVKSAVCLLTVGVVALQGPVVAAQAGVVECGTSIGGITEALDKYYSSMGETDTADSTELFATDYVAPENLAIANVSTHLNIRKEPSVDSDKVGILASGGACIVESVDENGWAKVTSGKVSGYACVDYLIMGEEAVTRAKETATLYATVKSKVNSLNVRTAPSTDSEVITRINAGERLVVSKEVVINKEDPTAQLWVEIKMDDDEHENAVAYVSADYVTVSYELQWATKHTSYGSNVSDLRANICDYAKKWIGTKYKWGGNSLTKGIDCSGFVKAVYAKFGYTTPRVSRDMAKTYKTISISELKPGDLVFYGNVRKNYINHVAIYIGNGQLVHALNSNVGIVITDLYIMPITHIRRVL